MGEIDARCSQVCILHFLFSTLSLCYVDEWLRCARVLERCLSCIKLFKTSRLDVLITGIKARRHEVGVNHNVLEETAGEFGRRFPIGSNLLLVSVYLAPQSLCCPYCNTPMTLKEEHAVLILMNDGSFSYARHPVHICQEKDCEKNPTRTYDSIYYSEDSEEEGKRVLIRQWVRGDATARNFTHRMEFVQCSSRFFASRTFIERLSFRICTCRSSFTAEAKSIVAMFRDSSFATIPEDLYGDEKFASVVNTVKNSTFSECKFLRYVCLLRLGMIPQRASGLCFGEASLTFSWKPNY